MSITALDQQNKFPAATTVVDPVLYAAIQACITQLNAPVPGASITANSVGDGQLVANTAVGLSALRVAHATYNFTVDGGGAPGLITPAANATNPANSIIIGGVIDWTTAGQGATNTTAIGVTGTGGATNALLHATAVASLTGIVQCQIVQQTASGFVKITTAGTVTLTTATAALTAGVCEIFVFYVVSPT